MAPVMEVIDRTGSETVLCNTTKEDSKIASDSTRTQNGDFSSGVVLPDGVVPVPDIDGAISQKQQSGGQAQFITLGLGNSDGRNAVGDNHQGGNDETAIRDPIKEDSVRDLTGPEFGDFVAELVKRQYLALTTRRDGSLTPYKVLAGVVMTKNSSPNDGQVVSVATGTKCVKGENLSSEGKVLNDSHAEILAHRGLVRFLQDQLKEYANDPTKSIFESDDGASPPLKLKRNIGFHIYISSAPCGDGRIFISQDIGSTPPQTDRNPRNPNRGLLRVKSERSKANVAVNNEHISWNAMVNERQLQTMCCSDKVCRWNVVGVQGSLLAHIVQPIYFRTIIVEDLNSPPHLQRALIGRIPKLEDLPTPYMVALPVIMGTTGSQVIMDTIKQKAPQNGMCWIHKWHHHEVINQSKGNKVDGNPSLLCKLKMFESFLQLMKSREEWRPLVQPIMSEDGLIRYKAAKTAALKYQASKESFISSFIGAKLGKWARKPSEQDNFTVRFDDIAAKEEEPPSSEAGKRKISAYDPKEMLIPEKRPRLDK